MHDLFKIKDLGELKYFLGLEIVTSTSGIYTCQKKLMLDLLKDTRFLNCKPTTTPMSNECRLTKEGNLIEDSSSYRRLIWTMLYLTRPDIAYPVQQLSQFLDCPTKEHIDKLLKKKLLLTNKAKRMITKNRLGVYARSSHNFFHNRNSKINCMSFVNFKSH